MFSWFKRNQLRDDDIEYGGPRALLKTCPACNTEYHNTAYIVCPRDRTMLLTPIFQYDRQDWFSIVRSTSTKVCPTCSEAFTQSDLFCPTDGAELKVDTKEDVLIPVLAEQYRLLSYVGRNKIFETYLARDLQASDSNLVVAVRYLHYQLKYDEKTVSRFLKLAKSAIGLEHPHIIAVRAVNVSEDGSPYMVCDHHVKARSLDVELSKNSRMAEADAVKVFTDIIEALGYAHENGIVHGAICTSNLFVQKDEGSSSRGLLANFGVAERLFRQLEWDGPSTETRTSNVYGDPSGVCPEFCHGTRPNELSDIYQVGCALYEALSGHAPFERVNTTMVLFAHMNDEPDNIRNYVPDLSEKLVQIIEKCLRKEPGDRYPSAATLLEALKAVAG